jgi:hypothetical protein
LQILYILLLRTQNWYPFLDRGYQFAVRYTKICRICKLYGVISCTFHNISQPNFAFLLILGLGLHIGISMGIGLGRPFMLATTVDEKRIAEAPQWWRRARNFKHSVQPQDSRKRPFQRPNSTFLARSFRRTNEWLLTLPYSSSFCLNYAQNLPDHSPYGVHIRNFTFTTCCTYTAGVWKKYRCLICYTSQTGQVVSVKRALSNSERPNLNFDIWHEDVRAILNELLRFHFQTAFLKMLQITINRPVKFNI